MPAACPRDPRIYQHHWIPRTSRGTSALSKKSHRASRYDINYILVQLSINPSSNCRLTNSHGSLDGTCGRAAGRRRARSNVNTFQDSNLIIIRCNSQNTYPHGYTLKLNATNWSLKKLKLCINVVTKLPQNPGYSLGPDLRHRLNYQLVNSRLFSRRPDFLSSLSLL